MVHDEDCDVVLTLQGAEVAEQSGDLAGVVLVDAVEPDEGVEHEEAGCELANGGAQTRLVASAIEAQDRRGDDVDRRAGQVEGAGAAESREPGLDDRGRVFGHVEEDGARVVDVEDIEAGCAGGDGDREVEGEPGLAALGGAAQDADGTARPEGVDEPAWEGVAIVEIGGADDRKRVVVRAGRHVLAPSSSTAAWTVASSRKLWPRSAARRIAVRRVLEATRSTPRLERNSISMAWSARTFWEAPAALKPCSTAAPNTSRSSGSRRSSTAIRERRAACCCMCSRRVSGGRPTSQRVRRSRLSNAKLRNPPRSRRKASERCWASSRMTSGMVACSSTMWTSAFLMSAQSWPRRCDGRTPSSMASVRYRSSGETEVSHRYRTRWSGRGNSAHRFRSAAVLPTPASAVSTPSPGSSTSWRNARLMRTYPGLLSKKVLAWAFLGSG